MVRPSCPALVIHDDDAFRKALIVALDQQHFTVTFAADGDGAVDILRSRRFNVVLLELNVAARTGLQAFEYLRDAKPESCGVLILGDPTPRSAPLRPGRTRPCSSPSTPLMWPRERAATATAGEVVAWWRLLKSCMIE